MFRTPVREQWTSALEIPSELRKATAGDIYVLFLLASGATKWACVHRNAVLTFGFSSLECHRLTGIGRENTN